MRKERGITLIALVITIIILLILSGITIIFVLGDNGLLNKAKQAGEEYIKSAIKEEIELSIADIATELASKVPPEGLSNQVIIDNLPNKTQEVITIDNTLTGIYKGYEYWIDENYGVHIGKKINSDKNEELKNEYTFNFTGDYKEFVVPVTGYYKIECKGASGGYALANGSRGGAGGKGAYAKGQIYLQQGEKLYIYVGQKGADAIRGKDTLPSYNGGGLGTWDGSDDEAAGAGGGATDIRLVAGEWNDFESLKSRIMVAAGGGGAVWTTQGGAGGKLQGYSNNPSALGGTQTSGYKFGIGQNGEGLGYSDGVGGAGSGYYGGTTSGKTSAKEVGTGGSSYISGYEGCNAIAQESTQDNLIHTNQAIHYLGKSFINSEMNDGNNVAIRYTTDGFVRITYEGKTP